MVSLVVFARESSRSWGQGISRFDPAQGALGNYLGDCARWPREMQVLGGAGSDRKGQIRHDGGVTEHPGLYLMGMQFLRRRKSALMADGAGVDARELSDHLASYLRQNSA